MGGGSIDIDIGNKFDMESEDEDCFVIICFFLGFWLCLLLGKFGELDFVGWKYLVLRCSLSLEEFGSIYEGLIEKMLYVIF